MFGVYDMRNDGKVDINRVGDMLRAMKMKPTNKAIEKITGTHKAGTKTITLEEFMPIMKEIGKNKDTGSYDDFMEAMKVYDKESNGEINNAELRHLLLALGERLKGPECDDIMQRAGNVNSEGMTKYEGEFLLGFGCASSCATTASNCQRPRNVFSVPHPHRVYQEGVSRSFPRRR